MLEETVLYYESEKEGLGEEFKNIVLDTIKKLEIFPELYMANFSKYTSNCFIKIYLQYIL